MIEEPSTEKVYYAHRCFFYPEQLIKLFTSNCDYIYRIRTRRQTCLSLLCVYDLFMNLLRILRLNINIVVPLFAEIACEILSYYLIT